MADEQPSDDTERPEPTERKPKERSWVLAGSLLGGAGTLLAAIVSGISLFAGNDDGGGSTESTPVVASTPVAYERPYDDLRDKTRQLYLAVPTEWKQRDREQWSSSRIDGFRDGTPLGPALIASPDIPAFLNTADFETPGIFVGASPKLAAKWNPARLVEEFNFGDCEGRPKRAFAKPSKAGAVRTHSCPDTETEWHVEAWWPPKTHAYIVLVQAKLVDGRDHAALDAMLAQLDVSLD